MRAQRLRTHAWTVDLFAHLSQECRAGGLKSLVGNASQGWIAFGGFTAIDIPVTVRCRMSLGPAGNSVQQVAKPVLGIDMR